MGPKDRASYFKQMEDQLDPLIWSAVHKEVVEPIKESVWEDVRDGHV